MSPPGRPAGEYRRAHPEGAAATAAAGGLRGRLASALEAAWWAPGPARPIVRLLQPLAWLYRAVLALRGALYRLGLSRVRRLPVPVVVVGNLIVGGAGKTPTVLALVHWLRGQGYRPGVLSRGFGRQGGEARLVEIDTPAADAGDEPLLIRRRAGVPVAVGRRRPEAGGLLLRRHPEIDLLVCDDGLQHLALARDAEVIVFDGRGVGNGRLLPAGPLRQPLADASAPSRPALVLYNAAAASTPLAGAIARRALAGAQALERWRGAGAFSLAELHALRGRPVLAIAGIAEPERFFRMLEDEGLRIVRRPLPDHAPLDRLPWQPGDPADVLVTEKDAVKLQPVPDGGPRVQVVGLDFEPPPAFYAALRALLPPPKPGRPPAQ